MSSCCGKKKRARSTTPAPRPPVDEPNTLEGAPENMVLVEYVGANSGIHSVYGAITGTRYRFADLTGYRRRYVYVDDLPSLLAIKEQGQKVFKEVAS